MVVNCDTCNKEENKLMTETLTKANETISMIAKDFMNRVNNG